MCALRRPSAARRPTVVLIANLRGLGRVMGRVAPAQGAAFVEALLTAVTDAAVARRGSVAQVLGDKVLVLYGAPRAREDDAEQAVRAALEMQQAALAIENARRRKGRAEEARARLAIGIATGDRPPGGWRVGPKTPQRRRATTAGGALRRAMRLATAARPGEVLIDGATRAAVASLGAEVLISAWRAGGVSGEASATYRCERRRARLRLVQRPAPVDPVCLEPVDQRRAVRRRYEGATFCFCSVTCAAAFTRNPDHYLSRNAEG